MIGPNYIQRLRVKTDEERLELRTVVGILGCLWAGIAATLASVPLSIYWVRIGVIPQYPSTVFALGMVVTIFGTSVLGGLLYALAAHLLRRRIKLDRRRGRVLIGSREIAALTDIAHVERTPSFLLWCRLELVFRDGK